jgi:hypothetical protein
MRAVGKILIMLAIGLAVGGFIGKTVMASEDYFLDWKIRYLNLKSPGMNVPVYEKQQVILECAWTAEVVDTGKMKGPIDWTGYLLIDGQTIKSFSVKYPFRDVWYNKPQSQPSPLGELLDGPKSGGDATNEFNGAVTAAWMAKGVGPHTAECQIAQSGGYAAEQLVKTSNNTKKLTFTVIKMLPVKEEQWPTMPKEGTPKEAKKLSSIHPKLSVLTISAALEKDCQNSKQLAVVKIDIRNASGSLGPGGGWVYITEDGGANLKSSEVPLPAIGNMQNIQIPVAIGTDAAQYTKLPGTHSLKVYLKPALKDGKPAFDNPNPPFVFPLNFPPGHCVPKSIVPSIPMREKK